MSENIPPQKREVIVSGDVNCFHPAVALWQDNISDEKHKEIPWSSDSLFEKNPEVFELQLFLLLLLGVRKGKARSYEPSRNYGHIFSCASPLSNPFEAPHCCTRKGGSCVL